MSLGVGDRFPVDVAVTYPGGDVRISELIATGPVVVAFHRLWCPFCQQAARDLEGVSSHLAAAGARVVIVYRDDIDAVCASCVERGLTVDCVSDPRRELERATDVERFSISRYVMFSPTRLVRVLRAGSRVEKLTSDVLQGRGTFVVDRDGRIAYAHQAVTAADIAPVDDIVAAVRAVADRSPGRRSD
ncbi:redoxin domain-containing protein [Mycolicibacterium mucogenicum]|uniref:redoxin domain-containing protein n=1 Tax=Mycolicibacterium mucogenicum TaxID=56689 RepID=UPI00226A1F0B|nr:redoxin domain-containing protein [Mycolicibacterium mucogenicum]MCX8559578.1 redoxin domain-containing protein [Mycolicibacterium mucogenicum]